MFGLNYKNYKSYNEDRMNYGYPPKKESHVLTWFYEKATWKLEFAFLPHICILTGKTIWLKEAYHGTRVSRSADNDFIVEHGWHSKDEHIIWALTR